MRTEEGGFASALDADSEGREGAYYVWSREDLRAVLGGADGDRAARLFGVGDRGNLEAGLSTLQLAEDPDDQNWHHDVVRRLLAARNARPRPGRDDKVVAAWNGLAVGALAEAGVLLDEPRYLDAATAAAELLVDPHLDDRGRLLRVSRDGTAGSSAGVLDDYGCVAQGFLTLYGVTGDERWYLHARSLVDRVETHFADGNGGFFDTADDAERLVARLADPTDNATPSGSSATAAVFTTLYGLTGDSAYREKALALVTAVSSLARSDPRFVGQALAVAEALADGPRQLAVIGPPGDAERTALVRAGLARPDPGLVLAVGDGSSAPVALLADRTLVGGRSAAYLCHDFVCDLPVTDPMDLRR
jgi:uncharacterized protein YyaL (SSP411 family)